MTANPFHIGHLAFIGTTLKSVDSLDIYVGHRSKEWTLPLETRLEAIRYALLRAELTEAVQIITTKKEVRGSILSIEPDKYDVLAMGSDIANNFDPGLGSFRDYERNHFLSFLEFVILQREGFELTNPSLDAIKQRVKKVTTFPSITPIKGTLIRKDWKNGEDISGYLPEGVLEAISPDIRVFSNQP